MQVKQRLKINVAVSAFASVAVCLILLMSLYSIYRAMEASRIADELVERAFERSTFREDYLRMNNERAKIQWFAKHEQIGRLLKAASEKFTDAEDRKTIDGLTKDHQMTGKLFSAIVENREKSGLAPGSDAISRDIEDRLSTQLKMRLYYKILDFDKLHDSARRRLFSALKLAGWGIFSALAIIVAAVFINSWTLNRTIANRILRLRDGTSMIGSGDLDHRIDIKGDDEFAELSDVVNGMTSKLRESYHALEEEIVERKRAEAQIARERAQLVSVFQAVEDGIAVFNMAGNVVMVNEAHARILGYPGAEAMRQDVSHFARHFELRELDGRIIPVEDWPVSRVLRGETFANWELFARQTDSGRTWFFSDSGAPVHDAEGRQILAVVITRDITARKQAQAALKESEERFRVAQELSPDGFSILRPVRDAEGHVEDFTWVYGNPALERIVGMKLSELAGRSLLELFPGHRGSLFFEAYRQVAETGQTRIEEIMHHGDGMLAERWFRVAVVAMKQDIAVLSQDITERKRIEEQIAREKYLQQLLLDHFPGVALLLRTATREVVASNQAGKDVGAVCGSKCFETWGQNQVPCPWCLAHDLWATGKEQHTIIEAGEKVFEAHWVPVSDDLYMHYAFDITERKRAEDILRDKEQLIQQALHIGRAFTFDWDVATDQVYRSDSCKKILGFGDDMVNATSEHFCQHIHPDDLLQLKNTLRSLTPAANTYTTDFRFMRSDGNIVTLEETAQGIFNTAGELKRVIGVAADITDRKRAEQELRESEERFRTLADAMPQLAWMAQPDGYIIWYNQRWYQYTGTTPEQMAGWGWQSVHDPVELPKVLERWKASIATGEPFEMTFPLLGADGVFRLFLTRVFPLKDAEGRVVQWFGTNTDVTALKQAEEAVKASLREKEVLLKEIHHRVKNNMQVISSLVSLQAAELQDAGMRVILEEVAQRVRSMALVHEKLYQSADLARVEFAEYTKSLMEYLWRAHGTVVSDIRLTLDLEPVSLPVNVAVPCGLILNELVINALKHAFRGRNGGEVVVSLRGTEGSVRLSVRDNGTGLPAEVDWRQARSLGLRLVQMLAGQLNAEVEVNRKGGTEFAITFRQTTPDPSLIKEESMEHVKILHGQDSHFNS